MAAKKKKKKSADKPKPTPTLTPSPPIDEKLELTRQETFSQYYAKGEGTFGNATLSYAAAYGYDLIFTEKVDRFGRVYHHPENYIDYNTCASAGSRLLRSVKVQERVRALLNELLKEDIVDAELAKVIMQDAERNPKVAAIREFNKLRGRIIDKTQLINRLPFGETDLSTVIAALPQERQDHFYAIITDLIKEAELHRGNTAA